MMEGAIHALGPACGATSGALGFVCAYAVCASIAGTTNAAQARSLAPIFIFPAMGPLQRLIIGLARLMP
jgi:hypothetical protein